MEPPNRLAFFQALGLGGLIGSLIVLGIALWTSPKDIPSRFEVADTYKDCKVVRYTPPGSAKYHYFLDCPK